VFRLEDVGVNARVNAQPGTESEDFQRRLAVQPKLAEKVRRAPTHHRVAFNPRFERNLQTAESP